MSSVARKAIKATSGERSSRTRSNRPRSSATARRVRCGSLGRGAIFRGQNAVAKLSGATKRPAPTQATTSSQVRSRPHRLEPFYFSLPAKFLHEAGSAQRRGRSQPLSPMTPASPGRSARRPCNPRLWRRKTEGVWPAGAAVIPSHRRLRLRRWSQLAGTRFLAALTRSSTG